MTLAPMSIGWPIASTLSGWLLVKRGYRPFILGGAVLGTAGCLLLAAADPSMGKGPVMAAMFLMGLGLGFLSTPYLLAVQNAVPWNRRGVATSSVQFFRSIGGAIAVAALGAMLNARLAGTLGSGADPNLALNRALRATIPPPALGQLVAALDRGLGTIYLIMAGIALLGLGVGLAFPSGSARAHAYREEEGHGTSPPATGEGAGSRTT
jgi:fucose permease